MRFIKWLHQLSKKDLPLAGGKGANLAELYRLDLPVPNAFIVTSRAYDYFLKRGKLKNKIKTATKDLRAEETKKISQASKVIKALILKAGLPTDLEKEIEEAYDKLGKDLYVAVRSSATTEDLPSASFAGEHATFLNIKGAKDVSKAVLRCFASLFEPRAIFYRIQNRFDHLKVKIAVPVEVMVQSEKSGVMFTLDPLTSDKRKIAIEAGFGLGEAIVSGSIVPDRYLVSKDSLKIVSKEINKQDWMIKKVGGKDRHIDLPKNLRERQKISDKEIIELAKYGLKIEKHYKFPQDIEWAIASDKIWILQTRPVTTIKEKEEKKEEIKGEVLVKGIGASLGQARGPARIIHKPTEEFEEGEVLVTEMTNPSFVPLMKKAVAIVTDTGGQTSHAAIVSRELGIPCVVGTGRATSVLKNGQMVTVDGEKGVVYKGGQPLEKVERPKMMEKEKLEIIPVTATKIYVNLGEPNLATEVAKEPCDGVGLLRAEFMIAEEGAHPKYLIKKGKGKEFMLKLSEGIKTIASAFFPRPVVYRATDFKTNEYRGLKGGERFEPKEENPMLGFRGAIRYLEEPEVFRLEILALRRVREQFGLKNVWLMIPFVRTVLEFEKIRDFLEEEGLSRTNDFKLWMMVEVPSNVFLMEKFAQSGLDGVSIGSNDLTQLILGIDRDNERLAQEFDERNEAVVLAIKKVIETCKKYDLTSSLCGQAPSVYPEFVEMLVESGITSISVNPDKILETKRLVASIERRILLEKIKEIEGLKE